MDTSPRLMIERVVLENFKSYAGRHQIGPFHKNFTAVVGPNGSGKSNLLECLLFAFGKRATKMRLKKLSELIHYSKAHPNFDHASVTVYFQDIVDRGYSDYEVVLHSQFSLSRIVYKSGHSKYDVNGHESSYEEVTALLKKRGIDLEHNRFLILQGEVEQIALMKPKGTQDDEGKAITSGLLDYLEEIIGTNGYVSQITEAEKRIEDAHESLAQRQNSVNQSKEALLTLENPKNEALAAIEVEKELFQLRNVSFHLGRLKNNQLAVQFEGKMKDLNQEKERIEELFLRKKEENKEVIELFTSKEREVNALMEKEIAIKKQYKQLDLTHTETNTLKTHSEQKLRETKGDIEQLEAKMRTLTDNMAEIAATMPQKDHELASKILEMDEIKSQYQAKALEVIRATEELQAERNRKMEEMRPVQKQISDSQGKVEEIQAKIDRLNQEKTDFEQNKENLEGQIRTLEEKKMGVMNELEEIKRTVEEGNRKKEDLKTNNATLKRKYDDLGHQIDQLQGKKQHQERSAQKMQSANKLDSAVKLAIRQGKLRGVRGRLGDLGAVPAAFDVAVSTAFGFKLDHYVVETVEDAQTLIDFVKDQKLGKVFCIAMDKLPPFNPRGFPLPRGAVKLYDSVQIDQDDVARVFLSVFGDTLITKTLDEARVVALGGDIRHKVVTQGGDIVNPAGDMQGFAAPRRGKMRLLGQASEDVVMEDGDLDGQIAGLETEKTKVGMELKKGQEDLARLLKSGEEGRTKLKALEEDLQDYTHRTQIAQTELRTLSTLPVNHDDLASLTLPLQKHAAFVAKITKTLNILQEQLNKIDAEIESSGGPVFQKLKIEKKQKEDEVKMMEEELQRMKTKMTQIRKDLDKGTERQRELGEKLTRIQKETEDLTAKVDAIIKEAMELADQVSVTDQQKEACIKELESMKIQQTALKEEFARLAEQRTAVKTQIKDMKTDMKKNEEQMEAWNREIELNKQKYWTIGQEFADLTEVKKEKEEIDAGNEPKRRRKDLDAEEKKDLLFAINTEFTTADLEVLQSKEALLQRLITLYSEKVTQSKPDFQALREYQERFRVLQQYQEDLDKTRGEVDGLRLTCSDIKRKRYEEFSAGFLVISKKLREMYQMLTRGGDAELEYADSTDPFAEGIVFTVRPPKKSWKKMANLSGGEKTLSSLALVFALHHYKPTALYVMDEVDAALDFQNVSIIANYIKSRTRDAQFIIVSLRYQNFELADRLIGVYKTHDASKTLNISPGVLEDTPTNLIIHQTIENIRRTQLVTTQT